MASLEKIRTKLLAGEEISLEEGVALYQHPDVFGVCSVANSYREKLHGNTTYYNHNLHLNSTNVCEASCMFCSFARLEEGMPQAYTMDIIKSRKWISERLHPSMTEIHLVNGLHSGLSFEYYIDLLQMIRSEFPQLHIKGFTAVEIHYFAEKFDMSYEQVLTKLVQAGLGSLPGGGAEIFAPRFRKKICRDKADANQWLKVHEVAHSLNLKSNCTMLYGTIETIEERVEHLIMLREQQKKSGGFQAFISLAFHNDGNRLKNIPEPTAIDDLRTIAISRIMLNNIPHIKGYWIMLGTKIAQLAQISGANDIDGTVTEEKIYHMAGSDSPNALTLSELKRLITEAGRVPVERTTTYEEIERAA